MAKLNFDEIYNEYSRLVYWAAYRVVLHCETAEDITQSVFVKVLSNEGLLARLSPQQLKSWLYRTSTNLAIDFVRKHKKESLNIEPFDEVVQDEHSDPETVSIEHDMCLHVKNAVDSLDDIYRQVIIMHYYSNLTVKEISSLTGISEGTLKSRLVRARTLLAEKLKDGV